MKQNRRPFTGCKTLLSTVLLLASVSVQVQARDITLIEMGDLHGTLVPHAAILKHANGTEYEAPSSDGLARLKTVVNEIRADNPDALLLSVGDLTHGSAEVMFTVGDAIMVAINAFHIDVYTPATGIMVMVPQYFVTVLPVTVRFRPCRVIFG